ncbi:MAG: tetratricopeptide repeat protein, partial [Treponemataceae bacterium]
KDPAVLRYSKYAAGLIRDAGQAEINQNLRFAMGLFEGLKLYGLNYVIDPTTPYKELSQSKNALDFLQFPNQTLTYKGGDCDDLSILFSSILESVGIKTGFITVPGHIYMAFSLDMEEAEARKTFTNAADLIFIDKKTWLPVEITLVNDSFLKAWQIGAKEWYDNVKTGKAEFILIQDAWNQFEPVGIPGEDTRIVLPPPDQMLIAYQGALSKFITREIQGQAETIKTDILASGSNPKQINRLGVLYARYGLLDQARAEFEKAGRLSYAPALTNLGNIAYLQKKFVEAISYFQRALSQKTDNKIALIGMARAQYEMENYAEADRAYAQVQKTDPSLAGQYSYLVSRTEGAARASSATERIGRAAWNEE